MTCISMLSGFGQMLNTLSQMCASASPLCVASRQ
jgi:hypothetical protein